MGTTKDNVDYKLVIYYPVYINNVADVSETTANYIISDLHPFVNYIFTAYIIHLFNSIKNEDNMIFCKLIYIINVVLVLIMSWTPLLLSP